MTIEQAPLLLAVLVVAFLYASVGHAGASGYIAVMTLFGLSPDFIKPTALSLNILVAIIGSFQFWRAGHFRWSLFWPFAVLSIPGALLGGYVTLPTKEFKLLIGVVLLFSAARFLYDPREPEETAPPAKSTAMVIGGLLGLLSGLTGTGGGIFLTPLVIFMRWAPTKTAAAISAMFILVNSISGLTGHVVKTGEFPVLAWPLAAAVVLGGAAGSYLGSRRYSPVLIKRVLAATLIIAGLKLIGVDVPTTSREGAPTPQAVPKPSSPR